MHNTKGDVALRNTNRGIEKEIISMILCSIQNISSSPFLSLSIFLNFAIYQPIACVLFKKECSVRSGILLVYISVLTCKTEELPSLYIKMVLMLI